MKRVRRHSLRRSNRVGRVVEELLSAANRSLLLQVGTTGCRGALEDETLVFRVALSRSSGYGGRRDSFVLHRVQVGLRVHFLELMRFSLLKGHCSLRRVVVLCETILRLGNQVCKQVLFLLTLGAHVGCSDYR